MRPLKYISILLGLMTGSALSAQQMNEWSVNDAMFFTTNPAFAALPSTLEVGITHGRKWQRLRSSPVQSNVGFLLPFSEARMGLGIHLFSEKAGPFKTNGISASYAYHMPLLKHGEDKLALGASIRLMHVAFDQDHLIANDLGDGLLADIDGNRFVPPVLSAGFHYQTGTPGYGSPVQFVFAGSLAKFLPFQDRFNTLSFDRGMQWHGLLGMQISASEKILVAPSLLLNHSVGELTNYALRVNVHLKQLGWLMTQYSKAGFLTTQIGLNIGAGFATEDLIELSISNNWNLTPLEGRLGNSLTFGLTYRKAIQN